MPKWGDLPADAEVMGATWDAQSRTLTVEPEGALVAGAPLGVYSTPILYTAAATAPAGSYVYLLRNGASNTLSVRRIFFTVGFQATTAVASSSDIEIVTLTGVTADALGTVYPVAKRRTTYPNSATVTRSNGVITATGGTVERTIARAGNARTNGSSSQYNLEPDDEYGLIQIQPGTGNALALRLNAAAVIGDTLRGWVVWQET